MRIFRGRNFLVACLAVLFSSRHCAGEVEKTYETGTVSRLDRAHAHNDYEHERPLLDALKHGFVSVEADIHLVKGQLLVAHDRHQVQEHRTLEVLYLNPLQTRVKEHGGSVYPEGGGFFLLIDIKSEGEATYEVLRGLLAEYKDMLTVFGEKEVREGAVTVVLSGNRPRDMLLAESPRYAGYDGRWGDLDGTDKPSFMPLVSDNWSLHFTWRGFGEMPAMERDKLRNSVNKAHAQGKKIRFWGTLDIPCPAREALWRELLEANVDLINTDDLKGLRLFLLENESPHLLDRRKK